MNRLAFASAAVAVLFASTDPVAAAPAGNGDPVAVARGADATLAEENVGKNTLKANLVEDLPFLRRTYIDLIGRIPTEAEIQAFMATPKSTRNQAVIDDLMKRDAFADRWAIFFGDLLRVRSRADGGGALQAFVHQAIQENMPYDDLTRRLISAAGKANAQPETAFLLGDQADPMALTGVVSQVFLGVRMQCAQCHDHPFDNWSQEEFYDLAAFFGKTRRFEQRINMRLLGVYLQEQTETSVKWPPEEKSKGKVRSAVEAQFPFKLDEGDGPNKHIARFTALRKQLAEEALAKAKAIRDVSNVDDVLDGATKRINKPNAVDPLDVTKANKEAVSQLDFGAAQYKASLLRKELAKHVTDPRNRYFSRTIVNRVWAEMLGRGFVNPIDDFKADTPPSHPKTLDYLADEFVASGYDFRFLVKAIASTEAYRLGHLPLSVSPPERMKAEHEFTATKVRRLVGEAMFDSIVLAGHLFEVKHPEGANKVIVTSYVRVPAGVIVDKVMEKPELGKPSGSAMGGMAAMPAGGYDLERGIEVDFKTALKKRDGLNVEAMKAASKEELEAEMMSKMEPTAKNTRVKYVTKEVKLEVDDNPSFISSMKMASPAPVGHFLRVFGQTDRSELDDKRDHTPSMRQALMMLNGKLTNEAARVGPMEPMHKLVAGPKADLDKAISLAYREILTREPSAGEVSDAKAIVSGQPTPVDGMADLRWALFNCNEFRYLP